MNQPNPKISVVMAVNGDDGFLRDAVKSILTQTWTDFEFLIVANLCPKYVVDQLRQITDPRVKIFEVDIGQLPFSLNYGIQMARGEWIARMDADDIALPDRFQKQMDFLKANPEVEILGTAYQRLSPEEEKGRVYTYPLTNEKIRAGLHWNNQICHPSVIIKRALILKFRGYAAGLYAEDYELWLRIARESNTQFANLPDVCLLYRIHPKQSTSTVHAQRNFAIYTALAVREFLLTKDIRFLLSTIRPFLVSTWIWRKVLRRLRTRWRSQFPKKNQMRVQSDGTRSDVRI